MAPRIGNATMPSASSSSGMSLTTTTTASHLLNTIRQPPRSKKRRRTPPIFLLVTLAFMCGTLFGHNLAIDFASLCNVMMIHPESSIQAQLTKPQPQLRNKKNHRVAAASPPQQQNAETKAEKHTSAGPPQQQNAETKAEKQVDTMTNSSSCGFRSYPWPDHHSGLPYLGDVFASHDAKWVYFIGLNRATCQEKEYENADRFHAKDGIFHRFVCAFPNANYVLSEYVHRSSGHEQAYVFRCQVPTQFQSYVASPQLSTKLHLDLHAIEDLEAKPTGIAGIKPFPSIGLADTPKLSQLPICHPVTIAAKQQPAVPKQKQHKVTAFTRVKTTYLDHNELVADNRTLSTTPLLMEWIEYHQKVGIDHFIVYDNDEKPHGPTETALRPMIDSGLVTYVWFPLADCIVQDGPYKGYKLARGQFGASLSALHRFGFRTKYFAHMDVDEFFVPLNQNTIGKALDKVDPSFDVIEWKPYQMGPCNGTMLQSNMTIMSKWRCFTGKHYAGPKLIFQPERILYFTIHYPVVTFEGTEPKVYSMNDTTEGLLAHYRRHAKNEYQTDAFVGLVNSTFTDRMHFMDRFVDQKAS